MDKDDDHSGEELNFKKVFNNEYNNGPEKANSTTSNIAFLLSTSFQGGSSQWSKDHRQSRSRVERKKIG